MKTLMVVGSHAAWEAVSRHMPPDVKVVYPGMSTGGAGVGLLLVMAPMVTEAERRWFDEQVATRLKPNGDMYPLWHMPGLDT